MHRSTVEIRPFRIGFLLSVLLHMAVAMVLFISPYEAELQGQEQPLPALNVVLVQTTPQAQPLPSQPAPTAQPLPDAAPKPVASAQKPPAEPDPDPELKSKPSINPLSKSESRPESSEKKQKPPRSVPEKPVPERLEPPSEKASKLQSENVSELSKVSKVSKVSKDSSVPRAEAPDQQAQQRYLEALAAQINRQKFYPGLSRRFGEQGRIVVSFVIQRSGELSDIQVVESSGYPRLDNAAIETLKRVSPFTKIPAAIDRDAWPMKLPVTFSLGR